MRSLQHLPDAREFERRGEWNVYTYECENGACEPDATRTLIEVPAEFDEFANRDPNWRGGKTAGRRTAEVQLSRLARPCVYELRRVSPLPDVISTE